MASEIVVFVTCGTRREANRLARALLHLKLAACVNIFPSPIHSVYRWKEKIETANEILLLIKSTRSHFRELEREIRRHHSYEVPEIIALPVVSGSEPYLRWIKQSVRPARKAVRSKHR
ncbi:MAG TPA: divalent-cation tolerance protein CutA [Candidatus Acidoferrales bacterium]|nr:divalent-cation tolerance protein CutA [Candidatus Acidoferrales bacterium]